MDGSITSLISAGFLENLLLILIGGAATGALFPIVKGRAERRAAREVRLVQARARAFEDIAGLLWKYYYLAQRLAYTAANNDAPDFDIADAAFNNRGWTVLQESRARIGASRWLFRREDYERHARDFQHWVDLLHENQPEDDCGHENWGVYQAWLYHEGTATLDRLLGDLADTFELPKKVRRRR